MQTNISLADASESDLDAESFRLSEHVSDLLGEQSRLNQLMYVQVALFFLGIGLASASGSIMSPSNQGFLLLVLFSSVTIPGSFFWMSRIGDSIDECETAKTLIRAEKRRRERVAELCGIY